MRRAISMTVLALLVACGGDKTTGPNAAISGNYTLRTVNGSSVPAVIYQDTQQKLELVSGNLTLNSGNTWSGNLAARLTILATNSVTTQNLPANGTYAVSNGTLTLNDVSDNSQLTGTVDGSTLSLGLSLTVNGTDTPLALVFQK